TRGRRDVERFQLRSGDPPHCEGLRAHLDLATDRSGPEAERELLTHLSVREGDDVSGVGENPDQADHFDVHPRLFQNLPDDRTGDVLPDLLDAPWHAPAAVVRTSLQEHIARVVHDERGYRGHDAVGLRRGRIVEVVGTATHEDLSMGTASDRTFSKLCW